MPGRPYSKRNPWKLWADGEEWTIDVETDLPIPSTQDNAIISARLWGARRALKLRARKIGTTVIAIQFTPRT